MRVTRLLPLVSPLLVLGASAVFAQATQAPMDLENPRSPLIAGRRAHSTTSRALNIMWRDNSVWTDRDVRGGGGATAR
jgi:hypothetical protein